MLFLQDLDQEAFEELKFQAGKAKVNNPETAKLAYSASLNAAALLEKGKETLSRESLAEAADWIQYLLKFFGGTGADTTLSSSVGRLNTIVTSVGQVDQFNFNKTIDGAMNLLNAYYIGPLKTAIEEYEERMKGE